MNNPYKDVFKAFQPWLGCVPAGHTVNFVGAVARIDRLYPGAYIATLEKKAATNYFSKTRLPEPNTTNYVETGAVLSAVTRAKGEFNMMELGAGTGPWTALAAMASSTKNISKRFFLAVEGEPTRSQWLVENMALNGISVEEREAQNAVIAPSTKKDLKVYFPVGAALFAGHGAQIRDTQISETEKSKAVNYVGRTEEAELAPARVMVLKDILQSTDRVYDVAHIDIQGLEDQVIADSAEEIQTKLRSVAIGTHGLGIEANLRETMTNLGWTCVFDFPFNSSFELEGQTISTKGLDGFQHWINPRLVA